MKIKEKLLLDRYMKIGRGYFKSTMPGRFLPAIKVEQRALYVGDGIKNATTSIAADHVNSGRYRLSDIKITFYLGSIKDSILRFFETQYKDDFEVIATMYIDYLIIHELSHVYLAYRKAGDDGMGIKTYFDNQNDPVSAAKEEALADEMACSYLKAANNGKNYSQYLSFLKKIRAINNRAIMYGYTSKDEIDFHRLALECATYKANPGHIKALKQIVFEFEERKPDLIKVKDGLYMDDGYRYVLEPKKPF